ncbi:MAG: molybdopterin-binding protein [Alphaproteobacteria bacterium]
MPNTDPDNIGPVTPGPDTQGSGKTAAVVLVGNEILSGRTQDANLNYIARGLTPLGIRVMEARVVGDVEDAIAAAVNACRGAYDYVFVTGGIGPTHDDITGRSIATAFGLKVIRHAGAVERLKRQYKPSDLNAARLSMADLPEGATLIDNPVSQSPGFIIGNVFVLAGVPAIMQAMFDGLKGRLSGGPPIMARAVSCLLPEGMVAAGLRAIQAHNPNTEIGSYPYFRHGRFGVSLVVRGRDQPALEQAEAEIRRLIVELGGDPVDTDA